VKLERPETLARRRLARHRRDALADRHGRAQVFFAHHHQITGQGFAGPGRGVFGVAHFDALDLAALAGVGRRILADGLLRRGLRGDDTEKGDNASNRGALLHVKTVLR
jgi:hypothetical protein